MPVYVDHAVDRHGPANVVMPTAQGRRQERELARIDTHRFTSLDGARRALKSPDAVPVT
jgi:hypothetical protein